MAIFLSISITLGAILILFVSARVNTHMLESVLFGSILTVSDFDLKILFLTSIILIVLIMFGIIRCY